MGKAKPVPSRPKSWFEYIHLGEPVQREREVSNKMEAECGGNLLASDFSSLPSRAGRPRFKSGLVLQNLLREHTTFELEHPADVTLYNSSSDEEEEEFDFGIDNSFSAKLWEKATSFDPHYGRAPLQKKKLHPVLEVLKGMDFESVNFSDLEQKYVSIEADNLVFKEVVTKGSGEKVKDDCKVFVHYVALLEKGGDPFDCTLLRKHPEVIDMRNVDVVPGLYHALLSMEVQEIAKVLVKCPMAYGDAGCPPRILPGADVLFIVQVMHQMSNDQLRSALFMTNQERAELPFQEIFDLAEKLRTTGNGHYKSGSLKFAVKKYRKAINVLEDYPVVDSKDDDSRNDLLHTLFANLAQCYLKLEKPAQACNACKLGLRIVTGKRSVKLLGRFAKAKLQFNDFPAALDLCNQAIQFEPKNNELHSLKQEIQFKAKKQREAEKVMYRGMVNPRPGPSGVKR